MTVTMIIDDRRDGWECMINDIDNDADDDNDDDDDEWWVTGQKTNDKWGRLSEVC
jgi:hypothetical protein